MRRIIITSLKIIFLTALCLAVGSLFLMGIAWCIAPSTMRLGLIGIFKDGEPINRNDYIKRFEAVRNVDLPENMSLVFALNDRDGFGTYRAYICESDPLCDIAETKFERDPEVEETIEYVLSVAIDGSNGTAGDPLTFDSDYEYAVLTKDCGLGLAYVVYFPDTSMLHIIKCTFLDTIKN